LVHGDERGRLGRNINGDQSGEVLFCPPGTYPKHDPHIRHLAVAIALGGRVKRGATSGVKKWDGRDGEMDHSRRDGK
jgi:hypothetical protein